MGRLAEHYRSLGVDASLVPADSPEKLETGLLRRDIGYFQVRGRHFDLVALRLGGVTSGATAGHVGALQGIPLTAGTKGFVPMEYHHIVRRDPSGRPTAYEAKLQKKSQGLFRRSVIDVTWHGETLAAALNADAELKRILLGSMGPRDGLRSSPDVRNRCVRIVFTRPVDVSAGFGILKGVEFEVTGFRPPAALLEGIDRIAAVARAS